MAALEAELKRLQGSAQACQAKLAEEHSRHTETHRRLAQQLEQCQAGAPQSSGGAEAALQSALQTEANLRMQLDSARSNQTSKDADLEQKLAAAEAALEAARIQASSLQGALAVQRAKSYESERHMEQALASEKAKSSDAEQRYADAMKLLSKSSAEQKQDRSDLDAEAGALSAARAQLGGAKDEDSKLEQQLAAAQASLASARAEAATLQETLEAERKKASGIMKISEEELEVAHAKTADAEEKLRRVDQVALSSKVSDEKALKQAKVELSSEQEQNAKLGKQLSAARSALDAAKEEATALQTALADQKAKANDTDIKLDNALKMISGLTESQKSSHKAVQANVVALREARRELRREQAADTNLQTAFAEMRKERDSIKKELEAQRAKAEEAEKMLKRALTNVTQLSAEDEKDRRAAAKNAEALSQAQADLSGARKDDSALERRLADEQEMLANRSATLKLFNETLAKVRSELSQSSAADAVDKAARQSAEHEVQQARAAIQKERQARVAAEAAAKKGEQGSEAEAAALKKESEAEEEKARELTATSSELTSVGAHAKELEGKLATLRAQLQNVTIANTARLEELRAVGEELRRAQGTEAPQPSSSSQPSLQPVVEEVHETLAKLMQSIKEEASEKAKAQGMWHHEAKEISDLRKKEQTEDEKLTAKEAEAAKMKSEVAQQNAKLSQLAKEVDEEQKMKREAAAEGAKLAQLSSEKAQEEADDKRMKSELAKQAAQIAKLSAENAMDKRRLRGANAALIASSKHLRKLDDLARELATEQEQEDAEGNITKEVSQVDGALSQVFEKATEATSLKKELQATAAEDGRRLAELNATKAELHDAMQEAQELNATRSKLMALSIRAREGERDLRRARRALAAASFIQKQNSGREAATEKELAEAQNALRLAADQTIDLFEARKELKSTKKWLELALTELVKTGTLRMPQSSRSHIGQRRRHEP